MEQKGESEMNIIDNDLLSIQEARILVENARDAQKMLATFPQKKLDEIVDRMAEEVNKHARELAVMSSDETDYGKWQDKYVKNKFISEYLPKKLKEMTCVGIINNDLQNKTMDVGVPVGVIIALCPATSPVSTTIYKALIAVKSGNAIIFSPNTRAKNTISKTLDIIIRAAEGYGLPEGAISYLHTITPAGTSELMNHKSSSLIINTGVLEMLQPAYQSGKSVIYGGSGNGPVFIERTADIKQAVHNIVISKTFDYGVVAGAEQSIVVDSCIAVEVKRELQLNGAYFMNQTEEKKLSSILFRSDGKIDKEMIGKSAQQLAKRAGFSIPEKVILLISEQKYVSESNPFSKELPCPVLAYFIEDDWMQACEKCIELLLSERHGHTLVIHSNDEEVIRQFALKKPVGRVLVNTPATLGSLGLTTNLFPALTLGSGSAGHGMTSDNVSPMNLIYIRKVGYGVRQPDQFVDGILTEKSFGSNMEMGKENKSEEMKWLQTFLMKAIEEMR